MLDISKLSPAPWKPIWVYVQDESYFTYVPHVRTREEAETIGQFIALARNAFDVMMRRGWSAIHTKEGWYAIDENGDGVESIVIDDWPDPFSALVEADASYRQNSEKE